MGKGYELAVPGAVVGVEYLINTWSVGFTAV